MDPAFEADCKSFSWVGFDTDRNRMHRCTLYNSTIATGTPADPPGQILCKNPLQTCRSQGCPDLMGDIDGNGELRILDAVLLVQLWTGRLAWSEIWHWGTCGSDGVVRGDFDGDGKFAYADAIFVARVWSARESWKCLNPGMRPGTRRLSDRNAQRHPKQTAKDFKALPAECMHTSRDDLSDEQADECERTLTEFLSTGKA